MSCKGTATGLIWAGHLWLGRRGRHHPPSSDQVCQLVLLVVTWTLAPLADSCDH